MYYVYKTTNLINNKIYIGVHCSDDIENDDYLGSGKQICQAIKKYGRNNFKEKYYIGVMRHKLHISYRKKLQIKNLLKEEIHII